MTEIVKLIASVRGLTDEIRGLDMVTLPQQLGMLEAEIAQLSVTAADVEARSDVLTELLEDLQDQDATQSSQLIELIEARLAAAASLSELAQRVASLEAVPPPVPTLASLGAALTPYVLTGTTEAMPLYALTLPAGRFAVGDELRLTLGGRMSGNRVKHMGVRVNGEVAFNATLSNSPRYPWDMQVTLVVRMPTEAVLVVRLLSHRRRWDHTTVVVPIDLTADVTVEVTGQVTRQSNSISCEMAVAHWLRHFVM